jgi:hypothetical protein
MSLQTISADETHVIGGQFLQENFIFNIEKYLICRAGTQKRSFQSRRAEFRTRVNFGKEE